MNRNKLSILAASLGSMFGIANVAEGQNMDDGYGILRKGDNVHSIPATQVISLPFNADDKNWVDYAFAINNPDGAAIFLHLNDGKHRDICGGMDACPHVETEGTLRFLLDNIPKQIDSLPNKKIVSLTDFNMRHDASRGIRQKDLVYMVEDLTQPEKSNEGMVSHNLIVKVMYNNGNGTFSEPVQLADINCYDYSWMDIDENPRARRGYDLFYTAPVSDGSNKNHTALMVMMNNEEGTLDQPHTIAIAWGIIEEFTIARLKRGERLTILYGVTDCDSLYIYAVKNISTGFDHVSFGAPELVYSN